MGTAGEFLAGWGGQMRIAGCSGLTPRMAMTLEVVSQHVEAHLGADPLEGPRQEMGCSPPSFDSAEWVLHGLSSNAHNVRLLLQTLLHGIDDGFVLPPFDATLPTG